MATSHLLHTHQPRRRAQHYFPPISTFSSWFMCQVNGVYSSRCQQWIIYRLRLVCVEDPTDPINTSAYLSWRAASVRDVCLPLSRRISPNVVSTKELRRQYSPLSGRLAEGRMDWDAVEDACTATELWGGVPDWWILEDVRRCPRHAYVGRFRFDANLRFVARIKQCNELILIRM